jgi:hypothetical protein
MSGVKYVTDYIVPGKFLLNIQTIFFWIRNELVYVTTEFFKVLKVILDYFVQFFFCDL